MLYIWLISSSSLDNSNWTFFIFLKSHFEEYNFHNQVYNHYYNIIIKSQIKEKSIKPYTKRENALHINNKNKLTHVIIKPKIEGHTTSVLTIKLRPRKLI